MLVIADAYLLVLAANTKLCAHAFQHRLSPSPLNPVANLGTIQLFPSTLQALSQNLNVRIAEHPPLCIGDVLLEDGTEVKGFLGEAYAVQGAEDVSAYGGWRAYVSSRS
eukprot:1069541-Pelagomonas_calceolata.AAC.1